MTSPSVPGIRERNRAAIESEVLRAGRQQLAAVGAAALSLRAVARELGMASSAVYRYVANRDDLLTLLIVSAYDDLGDRVDAALDAPGAPGPDDPRGRFGVLCHAVRRWALDHPHDYALLYGSPVPHYDAPAERTTAAGTRVQAHLLEILGASPAGQPSGDRAAVAAAAAGLSSTLADPFFAATAVTGEGLVRGLAAWSLVLGALSSELFVQLGTEAVPDPDGYFAAMVSLAADLVLPPPPRRPVTS